MQGYVNKLTPRAWMLIALPIAAVAYPVIATIVCAVVRAIVPDAVLTVLRLI
jgi:hypothetical protein